ncbi:hypothetical protein DPMN_030716 [Dreissena polymorpha]|uniref:Uncharacterized protein n=1 Tax=Dreissena polymorpha TaxID=45954 RepID=A0A9D4RGM5_DREPO|nr:hypothetical protein DPMN_030716 [Dreissena polymorpha]
MLFYDQSGTGHGSPDKDRRMAGAKWSTSDLRMAKAIWSTSPGKDRHDRSNMVDVGPTYGWSHLMDFIRQD